MIIDSSKAPSDTAVWCEAINAEHRKYSGWHEKMLGGGYRPVGPDRINMSSWIQCNEGVLYQVYERPKPGAWSGEGLPPVGIEIEANFPVRDSHAGSVTYKWRRVIVAVAGIPRADKECLCYDVETTAPAWVDEFRPLRTPEQIAAEERDSAIKEIGLVTGLRARDGQIEVATRLYEAGYRKVEGGAA